jgi:uncharacterized protein YjiS (DUF1127 family)
MSQQVARHSLGILHGVAIKPLASGQMPVMRLWWQRFSSRRALRKLDARLLGDIGIDPAVAAREVNKPFWVE